MKAFALCVVVALLPLATHAFLSRRVSGAVVLLSLSLSRFLLLPPFSSLLSPPSITKSVQTHCTAVVQKSHQSVPLPYFSAQALHCSFPFLRSRVVQVLTAARGAHLHPPGPGGGARADTPTTENCTLYLHDQVRGRRTPPGPPLRSPVLPSRPCLVPLPGPLQLTDHFQWRAKATADVPLTYKQRVFINDDHWKKGGPIFFYAGNEGDVGLYGARPQHSVETEGRPGSRAWRSAIAPPPTPLRRHKPTPCSFSPTLPRQSTTLA